jgi:hypothetical protein
MKYNHKFTCQILLLHRNKGRNGLLFEHFEGHNNTLYIIFVLPRQKSLCSNEKLFLWEILNPDTSALPVPWSKSQLRSLKKDLQHRGTFIEN